MEKFTKAQQNELVNSSMIGVGTYMGGHFSKSKNSETNKHSGFTASYSEMLEQAQKQNSSAVAFDKEYSL